LARSSRQRSAGSPKNKKNKKKKKRNETKRGKREKMGSHENEKQQPNDHQ